MKKDKGKFYVFPPEVVAKAMERYLDKLKLPKMSKKAIKNGLIFKEDQPPK